MSKASLTRKLNRGIARRKIPVSQRWTRFYEVMPNRMLVRFYIKSYPQLIITRPL
jgi:hypothetical protein